MRFIQAYVSMASQKKIISILIAEEIHLHYLCQMPEASPHNQIRLSIISIQFLISMRFARSCRLSIESLPMHFHFEFVHNFSRSNYVIGLHCVNVRSLHSFFIVNSQLTITHIQISTCNVSQREPTIVVLNMQWHVMITFTHCTVFFSSCLHSYMKNWHHLIKTGKWQVKLASSACALVAMCNVWDPQTGLN